MAKVISLNVGRPRTIAWHGDDVETSIFKSSVDGPHRVHTLGISGNEQADLRVHGGINTAV
jgi:MOSC domain-containing protein YiiM